MIIRRVPRRAKAQPHSPSPAYSVRIVIHVNDEALARVDALAVELAETVASRVVDALHAEGSC